MMLKRIGIVFLSATLILGTVAANCSAWQIIRDSDLSDEAWDALCETPLPPKYENYKWRTACDFAHFRDREIPRLKFGIKAMYFSLGVAMSMVFAGFVNIVAAKVFGDAATGAAAATKMAKLRIAAEGGTGSGIGALATIGLSYLDWLWPPDLTNQVKCLKEELGISDYYVFGAAETWMSEVTLPLGAWMKLQVDPVTEYPQKHPRVFRLRDPELDFSELGSRVWERSLSGSFEPITVPFVFGYERTGGENILGVGERKLPKFTVKADTPEKGGKVVGKFHLGRHSTLGMAGLREIHLCSPVNRGLMVKNLDDYVFAIVVNKQTVEVSPSMGSLKVGERLEVRVHIPGFHTGKATIGGSDGKQYPWEDIADAIFKGTSLQGAGIMRTHVKHAQRDRYTLLEGKPTRTGKVKLILQTMHGPVEWEMAAVEEEIKLKETKPEEGKPPVGEPEHLEIIMPTMPTRPPWPPR